MSLDIDIDAIIFIYIGDNNAKLTPNVNKKNTNVTKYYPVNKKRNAI